MNKELALISRIFWSSMGSRYIILFLPSPILVDKLLCADVSK